MYDSIPTLSPEEAADLVVKAIIQRPSRVATRMGIFAATLNALVPKAYEVIMNTAFEMFPDSAAAKGDRNPAQETDQRADCIRRGDARGRYGEPVAQTPSHRQLEPVGGSISIGCSVAPHWVMSRRISSIRTLSLPSLH
jgi:hypothetical protein